jgi:carbamoyltransferase
MITLGINYSQMHDSSSCLIRDGQLLFALGAERISRLKHDSRFPRLTIQACLDFAKIHADQIDEVCFGWQAPAATFRHDLKL